MRAFARTLSQLPLAVAALALFALMGLTFIDVVLRSVINAPIEAATELIRLLMAVVVFSALPAVSWRGNHITVDLLDGLLRRLRVQRAMEALVSLACGVALWFPARRIVDLAERARSYGDQTEYLHIPTFYIAWLIAVSVFVSAAILVLRGLALAVTGKVPGGQAND